ncbi:MAG: sulfur carrier protein ThiS [Gemmatimonadetes bacterium]|nr:sulfur carrier protein ThiS [Gemmatimonadota bacterium]
MGECVVNGKERPLASPVPLLTLLSELGLESRWALIELNGEPVDRAAYEATMVEDGDRLEIATPMAGG